MAISNLSTGKRQLVQTTADLLRERIFACAAGDQIGSLPELAQETGVGIVTVQQAARILEHEGLLEVRRGPGGGYFGRRPDSATLERSLAAYMRSKPASQREILDITSLLFNELCAAAAGCTEPELRHELAELAQAIASCPDGEAIGALEDRLQNQLFRMVDRPLFELLTRVALQMAYGRDDDRAKRSGFNLAAWQDSRRHIIDAILRGDRELAKFEADRRNRRIVMEFAAMA
jgi:DNA-binding FadR family transcriptional regulator